jgi:hypothetical protein
VNYALLQGTQSGYPREYFLNLAAVESTLAAVSANTPFDFRSLGTIYSSVLASYEAVGEDQTCTKEDICKWDMGGIILTIQNRYQICQKVDSCPFHRYAGLPSHPTRSEIITADCAVNDNCLQYNGLEHWILTEQGNGCYQGTKCYNLSNSKTSERWNWAFDIATKIFSGKSDKYIDRAVLDIGKRVNFLPGRCPASSSSPTPGPSPTPDPAGCVYPYQIHHFWGP